MANPIFHNYFESRTQAGQVLKKYTAKYSQESPIILALGSGGVIVGVETARSLKCQMAVLMTKDIYLPDGRTILGIINELGGFIHNNAFSTGEIEEFSLEYRNHIDFAKMQAVHDLQVAIGDNKEIDPSAFRNKTIITITDGAKTGLSFEMTYEFLKPVRYKKLVIATPLASTSAVDKMHQIADEIICLSVKENPFDIDHYYENNDIPDNESIRYLLKSINKQSL